MKKIIVMAVLFINTTFISCGGQKPAVSVAPQNIVDEVIGQAAPVEPCIVLAEEAPAIRKYGNGLHLKESVAKNTAEMQARASFARSIAAAITSASEEVGVSLEQYVGDDTTGRTVSDQSDESSDYVLSIAKEVVKNTHPIKTSRYIKPNKQFNYYVCIEYLGDENHMVEQIEDLLKDKFTPEDRAKLEQRHDAFRQRVLNYLNNEE